MFYNLILLLDTVEMLIVVVQAEAHTYGLAYLH